MISSTRKQPTRKPRAYAPDPSAPGQACDSPGCPHEGEYRAPKSRAGSRDFHWFCLDHVREFNASWDYYKGMSAEEIEAQLRADTSWQRPSWPLGRLGQTSRMDETLEAELHAFAFGARPKPAPNPGVPADIREALSVLNLTWPVTLATVKAKYKELAKRHHPDSNNGDKHSEEMLKSINLAYAALRGKLAAKPAQASQTSGR
ncbi:J domain-containing protein [Acidocella sp.]|uniref:J domain-containing protein n=1 Tax=Acidocella sp. TaxID=50710 RepID=UPI0017FF9741|nr:J domain-containing protein [Acidocella sp.]NNM55807.1 J domain-containing protein [Acidocella sp.]